MNATVTIETMSEIITSPVAERLNFFDEFTYAQIQSGLSMKKPQRDAIKKCKIPWQLFVMVYMQVKADHNNKELLFTVSFIYV